MAFRRARISGYGGRTLSANGNGINISPRIPETQKLQHWWNSGRSSAGMTKRLSLAGGGGASHFPKFEERKAIGSIKGENLGYTNVEKTD